MHTQIYLCMSINILWFVTYESVCTCVCVSVCLNYQGIITPKHITINIFHYIWGCDKKKKTKYEKRNRISFLSTSWGYQPPGQGAVAVFTCLYFAQFHLWFWLSHSWVSIYVLQSLPFCFLCFSLLSFNISIVASPRHPTRRRLLPSQKGTFQDIMDFDVQRRTTFSSIKICMILKWVTAKKRSLHQKLAKVSQSVSECAAEWSVKLRLNVFMGGFNVIIRNKNLKWIHTNV